MRPARASCSGCARDWRRPRRGRCGCWARIGRAMVMDADILCVDEVLLGLDADELVRLRKILERYRKAGRPTIVATVNAPTSLLRVMDRLVLLRDGRLVATCPPAEALQV